MAKKDEIVNDIDIVNKESDDIGTKKTFGKKIKSSATTVGRGIKTGTIAVGKGVKTGVTTIGKGVRIGATTVGRGVKTGATTVGKGVKTGTIAVAKGVKTGATAVGRGVKTGATAVAVKLGPKAQTIRSDVLTIFNNFISPENKNNDFESYYNSSEKSTKISTLNNIDFSNDFENKKKKIVSFLNYIANDDNQQFAKKNKKSINLIINESVASLIDNDKKLSLDENTYKKIKNYQVANFKRRKKWKKRNFVAKKILAPALVTGAITGGVASIVSAFRSIIGSSYFISTVPFLEILNFATIGFCAGTIATASIIVAKNKLTKFYYNKKYGVKSNNLYLLNNSKAKSIEDVKSLNLPIVKLLDKIKATDEKLIELSNKGTNFLRHPINSIKSFFLTKTNRNRMHEVVGFNKLINQKLNDNKLSDNVKHNLELLKDTISEYKKDITENRVRVVLGKNKVIKKPIFEYSDILAKEELSQENIITDNGKTIKKPSENLVTRRAKEIMEQTIKNRLVETEEEARYRVEEELKQKQAEYAKRKAEKELKRKQAEDAKRKAEEELKRKQAEAEEAKRKAKETEEQLKRKQAEAEDAKRKVKEETEARHKAEAEAEEAKRKTKEVEEELKRKQAEEELKRKKAEEDKLKRAQRINIQYKQATEKAVLESLRSEERINKVSNDTGIDRTTIKKIVSDITIARYTKYGKLRKTIQTASTKKDFEPVKEDFAKIVDYINSTEKVNDKLDTYEDGYEI